MEMFNINKFCGYFTLSTGSWIIGWWYLIYCSLVISVHCIFLLGIHPNDQNYEINAERVYKMIILIKGLQLIFTSLLIVGTYKGHQNCIFFWIIANSTLTLFSAILFFRITAITYNWIEVIFTILLVFEVYCTWVVNKYRMEVDVQLQ